MKISFHISSLYIENRIDNGISSINIVTSSVGTVDSGITVHMIVIESKIVVQQVQQLLYTQEDQEISLWTRKKVKALVLNVHLKMLEDRKAIVNR